MDLALAGLIRAGFLKPQLRNTMFHIDCSLSTNISWKKITETLKKIRNETGWFESQSMPVLIFTGNI